MVDKHAKANTYDAIVVGTGISGGWAAKELSEGGLQTLVLERGRNVRHIQDYPTAHTPPWEFPHGNRLSQADKKRLPVQSRAGIVKPESMHFFVDDQQHPFIEEKPFDWVRGYQVGGRSLTWSRKCFRWSDLDFEANVREGLGVDWPIRYKDIAPWYDYVETHIGLSGSPQGLAHLPDSKFLPPMGMNCVEAQVAERVGKQFAGEGRMIIETRLANLSQAHKGRSQCMFRNRCRRGCPFGAYFSSLSSTLPAATATGNMTLRPFSVVSEVLYDDRTNRAIGVRVIDQNTRKVEEFYAKVIFLNASTLGSTFIMLNSKSKRFPDGLGNDSGQLGLNLMDHHFQVGARGVHPGLTDSYYYGRQPHGVYVPRFRNVKTKHGAFLRGFGFQGSASRQDWTRAIGEMSIGAQLKQSLSEPGPWTMGLNGFGEFLPNPNNRVKLDESRRDPLGLPMLSIRCEPGENERAMRLDMQQTAAEILEAGGLKNVKTYDSGSNPGLAIHEMGTARMGKDPKTSVLGKFNQVHGAKNVFVTDGACMASTACQNPSLTYMALTARATHHALGELKKGNL